MANVFAASGGYDKVNLKGGFEDVWNGLQGEGAFKNIMTLVTAVGAVLVVGSILKWLWDRRRSGGGGGGRGSEGILWALALGATMSAPKLLLPIMLGILDTIANGVAGVFKSTGNGN